MKSELITLGKIVIHKILYTLFGKHQRKNGNIEKTIKDKRVLVQINSGIGDAIMALPMLNQLRRNDYKIYVLANRVNIKIFRLNPNIQAVICLEPGVKGILYNFIELLKIYKLRNPVFIGTLPSNDIRDVIISFLLRSKIRIKHFTARNETYRNYDFFFTHLVSHDQGQNNTIGNIDLIAQIPGVSVCEPYEHNILLNVDVLSGIKATFKKYKINKKSIVGIHPGCKATWAFKRWPPEKYAKLINVINEKCHANVILFGGNDDVSDGKIIMQQTQGCSVSFIDKLSLEETITAISLCDIFITNDSSLMHVASMFKLPIVALFGNTDEILTGPFSNSTIIKKTDVKNISVAEVIPHVLNLLGGN